jgi:predicted RNase H-like HicB family nuclease
MMRLYAVIHPDAPEGYWAEVPALPQLRVRALTRRQLSVELRQAVETFLVQRDGSLPGDALEVREGESAEDLIARLEAGGPLSPA